MLIYLCGTENKKRIETAVYEIQMENTIFIGEPIISNSIDLLQEIKSNLSKNKEVTAILIDMSVIINEDDDIIKSIKTMRFYNPNCKFIIVATERIIGDPLLSELVNMGVYNIIINDDELTVKIKDYVINNGTYKEASVYQIQSDNEVNKKSKKVKTKSDKVKLQAKKENKKIIVKNIKGKIIISVIGTQTRVGVTHTSILLAFNLMKKGYRVAVLEYNNNSDYEYLSNCYEHNCYTNDIATFLKIQQVEFYKNVDKDMLGMIQGLEYDYIIIDNGNIDTCDIAEHNRADIKVVVFGSKAWEQHNLGKVLALGENITNNYRYLTIADEKTKKDILEEMKPLKVSFLNFKPEPFTEDESILDVMEGYLYEEVKKKTLFSRIFK